MIFRNPFRKARQVDPSKYNFVNVLVLQALNQESYHYLNLQLKLNNCQR